MKITCAEKSVVHGGPLGPIKVETNEFIFRWSHVGTSPQTFTAEERWFHPKSDCEFSGQIMPFSEHPLGCAKCGCAAHTLVTVEIRPVVANSPTNIKPLVI